jgi:hypothetical protein
MIIEEVCYGGTLPRLIQLLATNYESDHECTRSHEYQTHSTAASSRYRRLSMMKLLQDLGSGINEHTNKVGGVTALHLATVGGFRSNSLLGYLISHRIPQ